MKDVQQSKYNEHTKIFEKLLWKHFFLRYKRMRFYSNKTKSKEFVRIFFYSGCVEEQKYQIFNSKLFVESLYKMSEEVDLNKLIEQYFSAERVKI